MTAAACHNREAFRSPSTPAPLTQLLRCFAFASPAEHLATLGATEANTNNTSSPFPLSSTPSASQHAGSLPRLSRSPPPWQPRALPSRARDLQAPPNKMTMAVRGRSPPSQFDPPSWHAGCRVGVRGFNLSQKSGRRRDRAGSAAAARKTTDSRPAATSPNFNVQRTQSATPAGSANRRPSIYNHVLYDSAALEPPGLRANLQGPILPSAGHSSKKSKAEGAPYAMADFRPLKTVNAPSTWICLSTGSFP